MLSLFGFTTAMFLTGLILSFSAATLGIALGSGLLGAGIFGSLQRIQLT
jgi:hypothetical protein